MIFVLLLSLGLLDISIRERVSVEPATVTGQVRILPREGNREACVTLYLEGERLDQNCWSLNGANEAVTFPVKWMRLRAGDYLAVLSVLSTVGITNKTAQFQVSG